MDGLLASVRAAGDQTRLRLIGVLAHCELTVSELCQVLGQSQPRISRHLKLMCEAGLLNRFQEGSWVFYRLASRGTGASLVQFLTEHLRSDDPTLARDLDRLGGVRQKRAAAAQSYFKTHAEKWDELRALHISERQVEASIRQLLGKGPYGAIADLGTGTGRILELLAPECTEAVGVDQSREMLALARANLDKPEFRHVQVRHGDIYALNLENGEFDVVLIHQVLHYLDNPAAAIFEAGRILKFGGRLLIADFAPHNLEFLRDEHAHRRLGFTSDEMFSWCRLAGLKIKETVSLPPDSEGPGDFLTMKLWLAEQTIKTPVTAANTSKLRETQ